MRKDKQAAKGRLSETQKRGMNLKQPLLSRRPELFQQTALQTPGYPFARIDNVLGDFSEQTGASFG